MQSDHFDELREICSLLSPSRHSIYRSEVAGAISKAVAKTLTISVFVTLVSIGFTVVRWAGAGVGNHAAGRVLVFGGIAAVVFLIVSIISACFTIRPSLAQTAERLDLSLQSLNQIATTYDLLHSGATSIFAQNQIRQGLSLLRVSCNTNPVTSPVDWKWRTNLARLFVILTCIGVIELLPVPIVAGQPNPLRNAENNGLNDTSNQAYSQRQLLSPSNNRLPPTGDNSMTSLASASETPAETSESALVNSSLALKIATAGSAGFASSKADSTTLANSLNSNQRSKPSRGGSSETSPEERSASTSTAGEPENSDKSQQNSDIQNGVATDGSSQDSGGKSDSQASPTPSDLGNPQRETGSNGPQQNGETDSSSSGSKSRREGQSASSNKANSAGHVDQPSHGRGDANSQNKKSRGVGSLTLGTAVPDLVIGKLLPGESTMSRREIPPNPSNSQSILPADTSLHGKTFESQMIRFDLPPADTGDLAAQYLIQLHSTNLASESTMESATGSAELSQPSGAISH